MKILYFFILLLPVNLIAQIKLDTTNLAIILINTNGKVILDEPKILADMTILWAKKNNYNTISDTIYNYKGKNSH